MASEVAPCPGAPLGPRGGQRLVVGLPWPLGSKQQGRWLHSATPCSSVQDAAWGSPCRECSLWATDSGRPGHLPSRLFLPLVGHPPLEPPWNHSFRTVPADPPDLLHCPRKRPIYGLRTAGTVLGCLSIGMDVVLSRKVLSLQFSLWSLGQGLSTSLAVYCVYVRPQCREALKPAFKLPPYAYVDFLSLRSDLGVWWTIEGAQKGNSPLCSALWSLPARVLWLLQPVLRWIG